VSKYNIEEAIEQKEITIKAFLSFGGDGLYEMI
jgi:hypothetical protein